MTRTSTSLAASDSANLSLSRFATSALEPRHRHDAWSSRGDGGIGRLVDSEPLGEFDMWADHLALGPVSVHFGEMSAQRYERTAARARRDRFDGVSFCLMLAGEMRGLAGDTEFVAGPGAMVCADAAQPQTHVSTASRTVLISLPRSVAAARFGDVADLHGVVADAGAARLLARHLRGLRSQALRGLPRGSQDVLARTVLDLIDVGLIGAGRAEAQSSGARRAVLKAQAIDAIRAGLASPDLDASRLAATLGLSRSTLYRLFEADGGVAAYIRQARLGEVRAVLGAAGARPSLGDLASRWGFCDAAHLSRAFRQAYGLNPSDVQPASLPKARDPR